MSSITPKQPQTTILTGFNEKKVHKGGGRNLVQVYEVPLRL